MTGKPAATLSAVTLDAHFAAALSPASAADRAAAIEDLLHEADLRPSASPISSLDYRLRLAYESHRLTLELRDAEAQLVARHLLSLTPFKQPLRAYYALCAAYEQRVRSDPPDRIETLDRARRHQHDALAELLRERLDGKLDMGHDTARRLMTLISSLFNDTDLI
jgi:uncharacterized protein (UPF0262 family)